MKWGARIAIAFVLVVACSVVSVGYLAKAAATVTFHFQSPDGLYSLTAYRFQKVPFGLNGWGGAPGVVKVEDRHGRVLDEEQLDDVESVQNVRWQRFNVLFTYDRGGRTYETFLDVAQ